MIFRNIDGNLVEINKFDFKNNYLYYKSLLDLKMPFSKLNKINNSYNYSSNLISNIVNNKYI